MTKGIYLGGTAINTLKLGNTSFTGIYVGSTKVWPAVEPLTATVNDTSFYGGGLGNSAQVVQSFPNSIATGHGGTGSYTFSWEKVSGDTLTITAQSSATTKFSRLVDVNAVYTGVYRCKVQDGVSTAYTPNVTVTLTNASN